MVCLFVSFLFFFKEKVEVIRVLVCSRPSWTKCCLHIIFILFPYVFLAEDVKPYQVNGVNPTYPESRYTSDYFISKCRLPLSSRLCLLALYGRELGKAPVLVGLRCFNHNSIESNIFLIMFCFWLFIL